MTSLSRKLLQPAEASSMVYTNEGGGQKILTESEKHQEPRNQFPEEGSESEEGFT